MAKKDLPPTTVKDTEANAENAEGDRTSLPQDVKVVSVADGTEHGYIGSVPDETPNEAYTVSGQTTTGTADSPNRSS